MTFRIRLEKLKVGRRATCLLTCEADLHR